MAYMVARTEKLKSGDLGGYQKHVDRDLKFDAEGKYRDKNQDIDPSRSWLNYDLVGHDRKTDFKSEIMDFIEQNKSTSRAIRKDAVVCQDWIIGSSNEYMTSLTEQQQREFFQTAVDFFAEKYGKENIRYATVHMDEPTPNMHLGIVPLTQETIDKDGKVKTAGRLSAKELFGKQQLLEIQEELPKRMQEKGFDIQRGEKGSDRKHLENNEYKELADAYWELDAEVEKKQEALKKIKREGSKLQAARNDLRDNQVPELTENVEKLSVEEVQLIASTFDKKNELNALEAKIRAKNDELEKSKGLLADLLENFKKQVEEIRDSVAKIIPEEVKIRFTGYQAYKASEVAEFGEREAEVLAAKFTKLADVPASGALRQAVESANKHRLSAAKDDFLGFFADVKDFVLGKLQKFDFRKHPYVKNHVKIEVPDNIMTPEQAAEKINKLAADTIKKAGPTLGL
jgi:Arc/MetJ family transcription regulator